MIAAWLKQKTQRPLLKLIRLAWRCPTAPPQIVSLADYEANCIAQIISWGMDHTSQNKGRPCATTCQWHGNCAHWSPERTAQLLTISSRSSSSCLHKGDEGTMASSPPPLHKTNDSCQIYIKCGAAEARRGSARYTEGPSVRKEAMSLVPITRKQMMMMMMMEEEKKAKHHFNNHQ